MNKIIIKKKEGTINFVFYMLLFFSTVSYYGYFCKALEQGIRVLNYYIFYDIEVDILDDIIRYTKDILIIILGMLSLINPIRKSKQKMYLIFFLIMAYGILILSIFSGYSLRLVLSGSRGFVYLFAMMLYVADWEFNRPSLKIIYRITVITLVIQLAAVCIQMQQIIPGRIFQLAGRGGYRFTGLFGGQNSISSYALGASMFIALYWRYLKKIHFSKYFFLQIICMFLIVTSGNRAALIGIVLFNAFVLAMHIPIKKNQKWPLFLGGMAIGGPILISVVEQIAERGDILRVQLESGRILKLMRVLFQHSFINVLFGNGLGYGTNAIANWNYIQSGIVDTENVMDGTLNTILIQFGMIGLLFLIFFSYKCLRNLFLKKDGFSFFKYGWIATNLVMMLAGNVLENYTLLIYSVLSYYLLSRNLEVKGIGGE